MELKLPQWASAPPSGFPGAIEPPAGMKEEGWDNGEEPPAAYFNWAFQAIADSQNEIANAITGTGGALDAAVLTQLLGAIKRQSVKAAVCSIRQIDDTGANQALRAVAVDTESKVVVAVGDAASIACASIYAAHEFSLSTPAASYTGDFTDVLYDPMFKFVAVGDAGEIQTSPDGATWTMQSTSGSDLRAVASSGAIMIAVGASETIRRSTTGGGWATQTSPFAGTPDIVDVAYGAGRFVIVTSNGGIASSATGMSGEWTVYQEPGGATADPSRVEFDASIGFVYHYGPDVYRSADGITWVKINNEVGIDSSTHTPGLLVAPYCWLLGLSDATGTSCEGRVSVTAINGAANFTANYVYPEALSWWKFIDGQLWALSGDKIYVGGVL